MSHTTYAPLPFYFTNPLPWLEQVLQAAGLTKAGMRASIPPQYVKWLNQRVARYMDSLELSDA